MRLATSTCPTPRHWAAPGKRSRWARRTGPGKPGGSNLTQGATAVLAGQGLSTDRIARVVNAIRAALAGTASRTGNGAYRASTVTAAMAAASIAASPAQAAVAARRAGRYLGSSAATASNTMAPARVMPSRTRAATGTGHIHARPATSTAPQHAPTTGPVISSLRAARRAGLARVKAATTRAGSPNSATAARAATSGPIP